MQTHLLDRAERIFATHLLNNLKEIDGLPEFQTKKKAATKQNWYGIVDGTRSHAAVLDLISDG